jgi:tRNA(His) 5'-end guanylyltransferase
MTHYLNPISLQDRMNYYRDKTDYRLPKKSYVLGMLDGRSFSTKWKNKLDKPFDEGFICDMNETAKYLCENIAGCKLAFVQSDEISLFLSDYEREETQPWFDYRLTKMLSLSSAMASGKFNQLRMTRKMFFDLIGVDRNDPLTFIVSKILEIITPNLSYNLSEFDSKFWTVPKQNDAMAWFIYRQNDCIRNSVLQVAYSYFSHKELMNLKTEEIKEKLLIEKNINWHTDYDDGKKQGRVIYKQIGDKNRSLWKISFAPSFKDEDGKEWLKNFITEIPTVE